VGIDATQFADSDVHVHVPAGATPKDVPPAGVAMFTALASIKQIRMAFGFMSSLTDRAGG
jgi:ATP-dependent Lon protease